MRNSNLMLLIFQILVLRLGKTGSLIIWVCSILPQATSLVPNIPLSQVFVCATAFFSIQNALQALSRSVYALSRDHGKVHVILDDLIYLAYPKRSSRWRLLRKDLENYGYASSCCLVLDHCQHSSWVAGSCQSNRCQCYILYHSYGVGFELHYSYFLPKSIPQSPRCNV